MFKVACGPHPGPSFDLKDGPTVYVHICQSGKLGTSPEVCWERENWPPERPPAVTHMSTSLFICYVTCEVVLCVSLKRSDKQAAIAQLGERQTEDLRVPGSIPGLGIT